MRDAFKSKGNSFGGGAREAFMPSFQFEDNMSLPIQILNPPEAMFPDGFPEVRRHWVEGSDGKGGVKVLPPIACTAGKESTGGNCLICYAKSIGALRADKGRSEASSELVIPIYDHTKYAKKDDKYRPLNPAFPAYDKEKGIITGGLKIMYASESQYRSLRTEHDNLQNECGSCGGHMTLESLQCGECSAPAYEIQQLAMMTQDEYNRVRYGTHTCEVCQKSGPLDMTMKCDKCGSNTSKTLYDVVILANRTTVPAKGGKEKKEYKFGRAPGSMALADVDPDELKGFWEKLKNFVDSGMTIQQQAERFNIQPPKEWLQAPQGSQAHARPYGRP